MIKHIVIWRLKDLAHGNDKATNARLIQAKLEALRGQIPGLLHIEIGINVVVTDNSSDIALYSEFTNLAALQGYQVHPLHQAIVPFVAEAQLERRAVDFEV
jgi:Stress responsive A/B Barrel Domain